MSQYVFVGTCSRCGGDVVVPSGPWASVVPHRPHCQDCGAQAAKGPIVDMVPCKTDAIRLDPDVTQVIADNLWDMYTRS